MDDQKPERCSGIKLSGPQRGWRCLMNGQYAFRGKMYCAAHRTIAAAAPEEFRAAEATYGRKLVRQEAQRKAAEAQIDAFLLTPGTDAELNALEPDDGCYSGVDNV